MTRQVASLQGMLSGKGAQLTAANNDIEDKRGQITLLEDRKKNLQQQVSAVQLDLESRDLARKAADLLVAGDLIEARALAKAAWLKKNTSEARKAIVHAYSLPVLRLVVNTDGTESNNKIDVAVFSLNGIRVLTVGSFHPQGDHKARVWDAGTGKELAQIDSGASSVANISADGQRVVTGSNDNTARVWNVATGQQLAEMNGHTRNVVTAAFSPDGQRIVTGSRDNTARVWNAATGQQFAQMNGHTWYVVIAAFSPDGQRVVTGGSDNTARVWNAATGRRLAQMKLQGGGVRMAKFSSDGKRVITLNYDYAAQVWDAATGNQLPRMNQGTDYHDRASFSPDGQRVVTATNSYGGANVKVFDAVTRKTTAEMNVPGGVNSMEFSPDGQRIVTANSDDTVSVWDATTGKQLAYLTGQTRRRTLFIMGGDPVPYLTASFSPNGRRVVTTSSEGLPAIYQIVSSDDVETIFGRLK